MSKPTIQILRETVRDGVTHEQRWRYDDADQKCEWLVLDLQIGKTGPYIAPIHGAGKLIVVERTYTERIVAEYSFDDRGQLTKTA